VLIERGSITLKDVDALKTVGAVGDICTRFFDIEGNLVNNEYNARTIGIELTDLKRKETRIAIAVGSEKADAIVGALRGGYVTSLYMDEITAASVLKRCEELGL
jgi:deoxyribonucleoside regulator